MTNLDKLKDVTKELAEQLQYGQPGPLFSLVAMIMDNIRSPIAIIDKNYKVLYMNPVLKDELGRGDEIDHLTCYQLYFNEGVPCVSCPVRKTLETRKVEVINYVDVRGDEITTTCIPLIYNGVSAVIKIDHE